MLLLLKHEIVPSIAEKTALTMLHCGIFLRNLSGIKAGIVVSKLIIPQRAMCYLKRISHTPNSKVLDSWEFIISYLPIQATLPCCESAFSHFGRIILFE